MPPEQDPKFDLDRLVALWSAKPRPASVPPAAAATGAPEATAAPAAPGLADPRPPVLDAEAHLDALRASIRLRFGADSKELAIALLMVDNEIGKEGNVSLDAMGIGDLVRAMFPPAGSPPPPKLLSKYRERLAGLLDDLEDLLDGLMIAAEARSEAP